MLKDFSIVIPVFNEEYNIEKLILEINKIHFDDYQYEIIFVNDASVDGTKLLLDSLNIKYKFKVVNHKNNKGQSESIRSGIKESKFSNILTLDGDGQNDPKDIPKLLTKYFADSSLKLLGGIRRERKDTLVKKISSRLANLIRKFILKDNCDDTGCSLKIFDKSIFLKFPFFDGIHRFLPALYKGYGHKTLFITVNHRHRSFGESKYGTFDRLKKGILDLIKVYFIIKNKKI